MSRLGPRQLSGQTLFRLIKEGMALLEAGDEEGARRIILRIPICQRDMVMKELRYAIDQRKGTGDSR